MSQHITTYYGYEIYKFAVSCSYSYYHLETAEDYDKTFNEFSDIVDFLNNKPDVKIKREKERAETKERFLTTPVLKELPEGWKPINGAMTAPKGTIWISNNISHFSYDYNGNKLRKTALLLVDNELYKCSNHYKENQLLCAKQA